MERNLYTKDELKDNLMLVYFKIKNEIRNTDFNIEGYNENENIWYMRFNKAGEYIGIDDEDCDLFTKFDVCRISVPIKLDKNKMLKQIDAELDALINLLN